MNRWALLLGSKGSARSAWAARLAGALAERGVTVAGVVQEAIEADGEHVGYRVRRVGHGDVALLARGGAVRVSTDEAFCSWVFDHAAFAAAQRWVAEDGARADIVLVDEVGKLEAAGRGHSDAVRAALDSHGLVVLSVRSDQLFAVTERFGLGEPEASLEVGDEAGFALFTAGLSAATRQAAR